MDVGKRILQLCEQNRLTVKGLADRALLTQSTVQNIVSGKNKTVKLVTIEHICEALKIPLSEFFSEEPKTELPPEAVAEIKSYEKYIYHKYLGK